MPRRTVRTDEQVVRDCNDLARTLARINGWSAPAGFEFHRSRNSRSRLFWDMAVAAYEHIEGTTPDDAVLNVEDEGGPAPTPKLEGAKRRAKRTAAAVGRPGRGRP